MLYCSRAQVLKVQRGAYKPSSGVFSWSRTPWSPTVSYVGVFPFYSSRWGLLFTYIYRGVLVSPEGPSSLSVVGPARSVGSGEACARLVLGDGLSSCCPVSGQSGGFATRSVTRRSSPILSVCTSSSVRSAAMRPSLRGFCLKDDMPIEGCLASVRLCCPVTVADIMEWCPAEVIITVHGMEPVDALSCLPSVASC